MQNSNYGMYLNKYEVANNLLTLIYGIGMGVYLFLVLFFPNYLGYWALSLATLNVIYMLMKNKLVISVPVILWLIFSVISTFGIVYATTNSPTQFYYGLYLFIMLITYLNLISREIRVELIYKSFLMVTVIFFIGSILQILNPQLLLNINRIHLSDQLFVESANFISRGLISGFTNQTGINSYILSVFSSFLLIEFFKQKVTPAKFLFGTLFVINIILIFMTGKRGFIIFNALIIFILIPFLNKNKFTIPISIFIFVSIFLYILLNTEVGENIFVKMSQDDISSGRFYLNSLMWEDIKDNLFFGLGTYTTMDSLYGTMNGHNIYLQVLRENGVLGFIPFALFIIYNTFLSARLLVKTNSNNPYFYYIIFSVYNQLLFLFWGATGNPLYDTYPLFIYIVSTGILWRCKVNKKIMKE